MSNRYLHDADALWPLIEPKVRKIVTAGALAGGASSGGGGVSEHDLGGSLHKGPLRDDQGPQFLLVDGSRALTGNLLVSAGVTIDGVDLSVHAADPDAHHARLHNILSASDHSVTGSLFQVVGLAGTNTLGLLTPSADVRTGAAESLLKSNAAGELGVKGLAVGSAMILSGNGNVGAFPDIQFTGDAFLAAEGSLYVSLDSDNNAASGAALIVGHNSPTTVGFVELFRFSDAGTLRITAAAPTISTAANDLTIAPANRTLFADDKQIRSQTHTAGFLGAGFSISWPLSGKAHLDIRSIYAEELEVTAFQADIMRVRVGEDFLGQGMGTTSAAFVTPAIGASVRVTFENNPTIAGQIFMPDEWVMLQVIQRGTGLLAKQIWGQVSGYIDEGNDQQSWLFTMRSGPVGLRVNKSSNALAFGFSGSGYIHHNVLRSANGPWTRYATWSGANPYTPANRRVHTQAGNLNGLVDISTNRYGIAAGNNLGQTPATGFSGFTADDTSGLRLFSTAIALYNGAVVTVDIQPTGNVKLGANIANAINTTFEFTAATGALRVGPGANAPTLNWTGTNLALRNSAGVDVILLDSSGSSYFAGVMTIGTDGEIRQGTGTVGSDFTGLRLWRDGSIGRIGGYKSNVLQWYGDTLGEMRAGTGLLALAADGLGLARYETTFGVPIAGTESRTAVAWWDNIDNRTGTPLARIYASRSDAGSGAYPTLSIEVDPANADADLRPSIWLIGNRAGFAPTLWLGNIYNVVGLPGIYPSRNATTLADTVQFSGSLYFEAHLLRDPANADLDVGTAGNPFRAIYASQVIATTISGASMAGQTWTYPGSMVIDAKAAGVQTVSVANTFDGGTADLSVEGNIALGGTVDGVDLAALKTAYDSHIVAYAGHIGNANAHHSQQHGLDGSDHTGTLSWSKVNKAGSDLADLATRAHASLTGIGPNDHHSQQHGILSSDHTVTGSALQLVGLTATNTLGLLTPSSNPGAAAAILRTDALGNVVVQALGLGASKLHSYNGLVLRNWDDTAYQDVTLKNLWLYGGNINSDNTIQLLNWASNSAQNLRARSLLASYDYSHSSRVPDYGIYSLGGVAIGTPGAITAGYLLDVNGAARFRGSIVGDVKLSTPLVDTVSGHLTISPTVDLLLQPGSNLVKLQSGVALQSHNYASQLTGMRVTALGEGDFRYLYTDEMHAKSFIADLEQALAGGQIISKSVAMLAQAFTAPAAGGTANLYVEDLPSAANMAAFQSGDIVLVRLASRAGGALNWSNCWGVVTAYTDGNGTNFAEGWQRWTFTRSTGADAGAMAAGTVVQPEAIVLDFGVDGNGYYEVNAIDGIYGLNSPYLQFVRWTGHPATGKAVRLRAGQLRGIFAQDEFGIFAGTGTANTDRYLRLSDYAPGNGINNLPFRLRNNGVTTVEFASWNNVWLGPSSADKRLLWNGTTLEVRGEIYVTGGNAATTDNIAGATNLVRNSSFELDSNNDGLANGFSIYNNDGGAVPTTASIVGGFNSPAAQRISWSGTNASTKGIFFGTGTRLAGRNYVIAFWARTSAPSGIVLAFNSGVNYPSSVTPLLPTASDSTWRRYAYVVQWAANSDDGWFVYSNAAITNGWVDFDGLMVYEGTAIVPYSAAPTDAVAYGGLINMPLLTTGAGLYSSAERLGYWNGVAWKMWMSNTGQFFFGGETGARLQWDGTALAGYDAINQAQWAASAVTGEIQAGWDAASSRWAVALRRTGIRILPGEYGWSDATVPFDIAWEAGGIRYGSVGGGVMDALGSAGGIAINTYGLLGSSGIATIFSRNNSGGVVGSVSFQAGGVTATGVVSASAIGITGGGLYSDSAFQFFNSTGAFRQAVTVGYFQIWANAGGAETGNISVASNASNYGYFNYNYAGSRSGYLLWDAAKFQMVADGGRIISLAGAGVSVAGTTVTAGYVLDVNGAARFRGSIAANARINLSPIAEPATSAATGILWMGTDNKLYFKKPSGTAILVAG